MKEFSHTVKVRYAETDQMGVVHHAAFLVWLEAARVEFLDQCGMRYDRLEEQGIFLPVTEVRCRYRQPVRFGEMGRVVQFAQWVEAAVVLAVGCRLERYVRQNHGVVQQERTVPVPGNEVLGELEKQIRTVLSVLILFELSVTHDPGILEPFPVPTIRELP